MSISPTTFAALVAAAGAAAPASAQLQQNSYSVEHTFSYQPSGSIFDVRAFQFEHAWLNVNGVDDEAHFPLAQDPGFDPWGAEFFDPSGAPFNTGAGAGPVAVVYEVGPVPTAGVPNMTQCTNAVVGASLATACTRFDVAPFSLIHSPAIDAQIESAGGVTIAISGGGAGHGYAFSTAALVIRGGYETSTGTIQWDPTFTIESVGDGTSASLVQDPIHFDVTDLNTGIASEFELLTIEASADGPGVVGWGAGSIDVDSAEAELLVSIPSGLVAPGQEGDLYIRVEGGVVTQSAASGVFGPSAPALGVAVPFSVPAPVLDLDYDLGLDPAGFYDVDTTLSGGAGTDTGLSFCPADLNRDGILDTGDIQLFLGHFLGGSLVADLNGDGILDTGDIQLYVFKFLEGCSSDPGGG